MSPFTRIQFATTVTGSGSYTLPINPVNIPSEDSKPSTDVPCLGSEPVIYEKSFDDRPIEFIWENLNADNPTYSGMINTLSSYVYSKKYIKLNSVQNLFKEVFTTTGWNGPYRIAKLSKTPRSGGGVTYSEVKLTLYKSQ